MAKCGSCPGGQASQRSKPSNMRVTQLSGTAEGAKDENFEMIRYMHPNRGQHPVYGSATRQFYGYRKNGDEFLVRKEDIAANTRYFEILSRLPSAPVQQRAATPPPQPLTLEMPQPEQVEVAEEMVSSNDNGVAIERVIAEAKFDLQTIPGISADIARRLSEENLSTPKQILEAGVGRLQLIKGLGPARARLLFGAVMERYGPNWDEPDTPASP